MKRITAILLSLTLALSLAACTMHDAGDDPSAASASSAAAAEISAAESTSEPAATSAADQTQADQTETSAPSETETAKAETTNVEVAAPDAAAAATAETSADASEPETTGEKSSATAHKPHGLILAVVLAVILIVGAAIFLNERKKKKPTQPIEKEKPAEPLVPTLSPEELEGYTEEEDLFMTPIGEEPWENALPKIATVHHIGNRKNQEDSLGVSSLQNKELCQTKGVLAVVADGMGGLQGGEDVSSIAVLRMLQGFSDMSAIYSDTDELDRLLQDVVRSVNAHLEQTVGLRKGGSTLISVILHGSNLSWISVGDSRTALFHDGKLRDLHKRHNFASDLEHMVQQKRITAEQAMNHPDRNKLTSFIGMGELKHVDRSERPMRLEPGDKVILMSDGVFNTLRDTEIEQILALPTEQIGEQLQNAVLHKENPYQDNFTAIVLEVPDVVTPPTLEITE